jgi:glucose-1-phosphate adenylyltransferase
VAFHEKKSEAPTIPGEPHRVYASMGNYIFSARILLRALEADALRKDSKHDFGHDILPALLGNVAMYAYDYQVNVIPGESKDIPVYWRDVGTLEAYYDAHMDCAASSLRLTSITAAGLYEQPAILIQEQSLLLTGLAQRVRQ